MTETLRSHAAAVWTAAQLLDYRLATAADFAAAMPAPADMAASPLSARWDNWAINLIDRLTVARSWAVDSAAATATQALHWVADQAGEPPPTAAPLTATAARLRELTDQLHVCLGEAIAAVIPATAPEHEALFDRLNAAGAWGIELESVAAHLEAHAARQEEAAL